MCEKLDLGALQNAVSSLADALEVVGDWAWFEGQTAKVQNTLIAGAIQNFEFVYEIGVKMIRRRLEMGADNPVDIDKMEFRDLLRLAAEKGLLDNVEAWFVYRKMRNITANTYDHGKALEIYRGALDFIYDVRLFLRKLEELND